MKDLDILIYWRVAVIVIFGIVALLSCMNIEKEFGWGVALLMFGIFMSLAWIALK